VLLWFSVEQGFTDVFFWVHCQSQQLLAWYWTLYALKWLVCYWRSSSK